jgi:hypothetical protein
VRHFASHLCGPSTGDCGERRDRLFAVIRTFSAVPDGIGRDNHTSEKPRMAFRTASHAMDEILEGKMIEK